MNKLVLVVLVVLVSAGSARATSSYSRVSAILVLGHLGQAPGGDAPVTVGGMGDSLTDEVGIDNPTVENLRGWLEILVAGGRVSCGPIGYEWPHSDPRRGGGNPVPEVPAHASYTYNFAKGGTPAMSTAYYKGFLADGAPHYFRPGYTDNTPGDPNDCNFDFSGASGKHSEVGSPTCPSVWGGFRAEAQAGNIEYGALTIGGIDFLNAITFGIPFAAKSPPNAASLAVLDAMKISVEAGLDVATANGTATVKMVLGNLFDLGGTPYSVSLSAAEKANIRAHVIEWNNRIAAVAASRTLPILDWWDWWEDAAANGVTIGGVTINVHGTSPFDDTDLTVLDSLTFEGVHPTPAGHALMANRFLDAIRSHYGADVNLLSDTEILVLTGLDPSAVDSPVPTVSHAGAIALTLLLLVAAGIIATVRTRRRPLAA